MTYSDGQWCIIVPPTSQEVLPFLPEGRRLTEEAQCITFFNLHCHLLTYSWASKNLTEGQEAYCVSDVILLLLLFLPTI